MDLVFTRMPGKSYRRWHGSFFVAFVWQMLINYSVWWNSKCRYNNKQNCGYMKAFDCAYIPPPTHTHTHTHWLHEMFGPCAPQAELPTTNRHSVRLPPLWEATAVSVTWRPWSSPPSPPPQPPLHPLKKEKTRHLPIRNIIYLALNKLLSWSNMV